MNFDAEVRLVCAVIICACMPPASAQVQPAVATLTRVEGAVYLDDRPTCRFRVHEGAAAVPLATVVSALRSGQEMTLNPSCGDMVPTVAFRLDQTDDFDRWSRQQAMVGLQ